MTALQALELVISHPRFTELSRTDLGYLVRLTDDTHPEICAHVGWEAETWEEAVLDAAADLTEAQPIARVKLTKVPR